VRGASQYDPPFDVPVGLDPLDQAALQQTSLMKFYKQNEDDFLAIVTLRYFEVMADPDPGALADCKKWYDSFCDLMTAHFLAAPSQTIKSAKDENGNCVNIFGKVIMQHLGEVSLQQIYAYDGEQKHALVWMVVRAFVRYVVIDCVHRRRFWLQQDIDVQKARAHVQELREGKRSLRPVPPTKHLFG
jgi:hypothetical protein